MDTTQANTLILENSKTSFSRNGNSSKLTIIFIIILYLIISKYFIISKYLYLDTYILYTIIFVFFIFLDEEKTTLPLLSESLVLDNLWETLSACLLELEYTPDHHAVLVLQVNNLNLSF